MLKTNLEWIKKNVPGDLKIWKEMISEIDWKDFGKKQANKLRMDKERIQSEVRDFIALSPAEKWDRFINGERQLGRLYQKGAIAFTRREWKGVESTARDFQNWLILWADMIKMVMRDPMSIALGLFEYRWFSSYLASVAFFDRNTLGVRGRAVTMNRLLLADVYRYVENVISTLLMADRRIGGNDKINRQADAVRRDDHGPDDGRFPGPHRHPVSAHPDVPGLRARPAHLHPVHRRRRELRPAFGHLPGADERMWLRHPGRPAALRPRLHLHLHPLRRLRHGHELPGPPLQAADLPAHAARALRRRGYRRVRRAGYAALHQVGRGDHR